MDTDSIPALELFLQTDGANGNVGVLEEILDQMRRVLPKSVTVVSLFDRLY
jgi:hypothetical protein